MSKEIKTEEEVKELLKIDDFRKLSKKKIIEFASLLPTMKKEVAIKIIDQFPKYADMTGKIVSYFSDVCKKALDKGSDTTKEAISAYKTILDSLQEQLKDKNLSVEDKERITNKMLDVAEKIAKLDTENKNFVLDIMKGLGGIILGTIVVSGTILGVNIKGKK